MDGRGHALDGYHIITHYGQVRHEIPHPAMGDILRGTGLLLNFGQARSDILQSMAVTLQATHQSNCPLLMRLDQLGIAVDTVTRVSEYPEQHNHQAQQ
ncbi:hypothetical protein [Bifidobacterium mongoliense]|uniref:hypothetical protein n=1 Tax=Bifidobacterium mongoliense TaxID=518643 RepID=UPI0030EC6649